MKGLTPKQKEILTHLESYIEAQGFAPSYRELQDHFGFQSIHSVQKHLKALREKGALQFEAGRARSILLPKKEELSRGEAEIELPFVGTISSGQKIETFAKSQTLAVPSFLIKDARRSYVFRIKDESFKEELIASGDLIIVEAKTAPEPGETILATLNSGETLIRRFHPEADYIRLVGESSTTRPILVQEVDITIRGVVVGLVRPF